MCRSSRSIRRSSSSTIARPTARRRCSRRRTGRTTYDVFFHPKNKGKGAALRTGIPHATKSITIIQDADLEYNPDDFGVVLKPILDGVADVVYGSRFLGIHRSFMLHHYIGNKMLTIMTNILYNNILTDMETGYKAFRTEIIQGVKIRAIASISSRRLPPRSSRRATASTRCRSTMRAATMPRARRSPGATASPPCGRLSASAS